MQAIQVPDDRLRRRQNHPPHRGKAIGKKWRDRPHDMVLRPMPGNKPGLLAALALPEPYDLFHFASVAADLLFPCQRLVDVVIGVVLKQISLAVRQTPEQAV
jgi:hypothetical protein